MSAAERVAAFFVTPAAPPPGVLDAPRPPRGGTPAAPPQPSHRNAPATSSRPSYSDVPVARPRPSHGHAPDAQPRLLAVHPADELPGAAPGARVCVLGGDRAGALLAIGLANRLARSSPARCAAICVVTPEPWAMPILAAGPVTPAARRLARALGGAGDAASVRGRVATAVVAATEEPATALAQRWRRAGAAPVVSFLPGVRGPELDTAFLAHDLLLVVVPAAACDALIILALAELRTAAPDAIVDAVPLPTRRGATARRAAVTRAVELLR